jgi:hypothetical protein
LPIRLVYSTGKAGWERAKILKYSSMTERAGEAKHCDPDRKVCRYGYRPLYPFDPGVAGQSDSGAGITAHGILLAAIPLSKSIVGNAGQVPTFRDAKVSQLAGW